MNSREEFAKWYRKWTANKASELPIDIWQAGWESRGDHDVRACESVDKLSIVVRACIGKIRNDAT